MHRLRGIGLEPSDLAFSANFLLRFDAESEHGWRYVEDVHELSTQFDGFSRVLAVAAAKVEDA
jgi:hypothetical protein